MSYSLYEIPLFIGIGVLGGLFGALFVALNLRLTLFRRRYVYTKAQQFLEVLLIAMSTVTVAFLLIYFINNCVALNDVPSPQLLAFFCTSRRYNELSTLFFTIPEESIRNLFHNPPGTYHVLSLALFFGVYYLLACWTYGIAVPSGLFVPALLTGAAMGRMIGATLWQYFPDQTWVDPGKFALLGAAAMLGGVVRMTISLTVIIVEATGNIAYGLPLMIVIMAAKWVGDLFNEGIYDTHINLNNIPILGWEAPFSMQHFEAKSVMSRNVTCLHEYARVGHVLQLLRETLHNAFPVVADDLYGDDGESVSVTGSIVHSHGTLCGIILRSQLISLLQLKAFGPLVVQGRDAIVQAKRLTLDDFKVRTRRSASAHRSVAPDVRLTRRGAQRNYPRYPSVDVITVSDTESELFVDLRPYMNPAPFSLRETARLSRVFRLFRGLGLRHLVIVNRFNQVVGMITRNDLTRYRIVQRKHETSVWRPEDDRDFRLVDRTILSADAV